MDDGAISDRTDRHTASSKAVSDRAGNLRLTPAFCKTISGSRSLFLPPKDLLPWLFIGAISLLRSVRNAKAKIRVQGPDRDSVAWDPALQCWRFDFSGVACLALTRVCGWLITGDNVGNMKCFLTSKASSSQAFAEG
jgi:hypothetical protein